MSDQTTWTHEPEYDKGLYVRVYAPQGLKEEQLRCVISLGKQVHKSGVLDSEGKEEEAEDKVRSWTGISLLNILGSP